ncbi:hypothetical protein ACFW04_009345 [Cataglyphis niger]
MNSTDIRVIFLYEYKLGNNTVKATRNINQAFGENTVNDRKVQRWFEKFWSSDFSLQNVPRGRPKTTVKNDDLKALVEANPTYCQYIDEMHEKLKIIRSSLVNRHAPLLLHDNARPHTSHRTIAKLNELKYEVLQHPAYSPDLSPTTFIFLNIWICFYGLNSMKIKKV